MAKSRIKALLNDSFEYLKYISSEFLSFVIYINAFIIGLAVNILTGLGFPGKPAPFIIPIIVQVISRSAIKYRNRHMERLVQLPSEREDPVFIMDEKGNVLLSIGLTLKKFREHNIFNIKQIIGENGFKSLTASGKEGGGKPVRSAEIFSDYFERWYEIKIKSIFSEKSKNREYLIWFTDVTELKRHQKKMSDMLAFSNDIISSLPMILEKYVTDEVFPLFAGIALSGGFKCVYISVPDGLNKFRGLAFKEEGGILIRSGFIDIPINPALPNDECNNSEENAQANISIPDEFIKKYPPVENIIHFIGESPVVIKSSVSENACVIAFSDGNASEGSGDVPDSICKGIQGFINLQEYISSYFMNYLKSLNEDFQDKAG